MYWVANCSEVSGDREVQRTMLELLNQLDGFSSDDRIKVCLLFFQSLCLFFLIDGMKKSLKMFTVFWDVYCLWVKHIRIYP